jgi:hypothetical protein
MRWVEAENSRINQITDAVNIVVTETPTTKKRDKMDESSKAHEVKEKSIPPPAWGLDLPLSDCVWEIRIENTRIIESVHENDTASVGEDNENNACTLSTVKESADTPALSSVKQLLREESEEPANGVGDMIESLHPSESVNVTEVSDNIIIRLNQATIGGSIWHSLAMRIGASGENEEPWLVAVNGVACRPVKEDDSKRKEFSREVNENVFATMEGLRIGGSNFAGFVRYAGILAGLDDVNILEITNCYEVGHSCKAFRTF